MKFRYLIILLYIIFNICFLSAYAQPNLQSSKKNNSINYAGINKTVPADHSYTNNNFPNDSGKVEIGIRLGIVFMSLRDFDFQKSRVVNSIAYSAANLHLCAGIGLSKFYKLDFRFGIFSANADFAGFDEGLFLQRRFIYETFYATAGIDVIEASGGSHNTGITGGTFLLYCFGIGYEDSEDFEIDIMYCIPNNKVYGQTYNPGDAPAPYGPYNKENNGIIKLDMQISFGI